MHEVDAFSQQMTNSWALDTLAEALQNYASS